jgi:c-di-GMP-binding flagellar brake protein YcgR
MKKLPIVVDTELFIQSIEHKLVRVNSRILGARHRDFIIIEHPVLQFSNRLSSEVSGRIQCKFILNGDSYDFYSRVREHSNAGFSLIDYPLIFEQTSLRANQRISVNIETHFAIENKRDLITVIMADISAGGCKLVIPWLSAVTPDTLCTLNIPLPHGKVVENLRGRTRQVQMLKLAKRTELGVMFLEPASELEKVASFCQFCSFFLV